MGIGDVRQVIVPVSFKVNGNGNGHKLTGPTIVLVPSGNGFPDWPPHGVYIQGYTREGSVHLAEREVKLYGAYVVRRWECGRYIYWQVWRRPAEAERRPAAGANGHD